MAAYARFAAFYDVVMDDPGPRAQRIDNAIARFRPEAATVLELGCGTGSILARLATDAALTGLDKSPEMLSVASRKVPGAMLVEGDMSSFDLGRTFDVIICAFDSLNHLLNVGLWDSLVECVHRNLSDGGLFVVDVNTVGELRRLGEDPPWVHDFDGGTAIIDVSSAEEEDGHVLSDWDIRIFEHVGGTRHELHHECIGELALPLQHVRALVSGRFDLLEEVDEDGLQANDDSIKAYYALRRRS